ncbi:SDR family NAD(P)-dependent oxidoreductase [Cognatiyoonia sp. IB215182]|uniref:SDR family NAD(P)-dependent oxidoreductase n=1 Tax=Cognatiyoonia sp. IB215182 TaxID=3097353 RepID=UPI002A177311|nr:SDR family oxidoreductase [Cognatiyoonia sp. IB215182]MDX8355625.1 SDR family oxidoreductase [Cognatiyoonia sp. IB215182]
MLLSGKNAVIYGAGGSIGRHVAAAFARDGAAVYLCGRNAGSLEAVADGIHAEGGIATVSTVDALDAGAVSDHANEIEASAGPIDISFNLIGVTDDQGTELTKMSKADFLRPIAIGAEAHFNTATDAARKMEARGSGVILALTATPSRLALPLVGGFGAYCCAIEGFYRGLAAEVGPVGVRVAWLRSAGSPETFADDVAADERGDQAGIAESDYLEQMKNDTLLKRFPRAEEVADAAVLAASDRATAMTASAINVTCGQIVD